MPRKGHKKSRKGCDECKKRHIKCDENRPICQRCSSVNRSCSFAATNVATQRNSRTAAVTRESTSALFAIHSSNQAAFEDASPMPAVTVYDQGGLTQDSLLHLKLFHNFEHHTYRTVAQTEEHIEIYRQVMLGRVFTVPYLMQAMLGLSALQLSLETSERTAVYKHAAAVLQSQALQSFESSNTLQNINDSNVLDLLLFQHLVALHVFCDIFTSTENDFGDFMDKLSGCIQLLRGLNSVTQPWWHVLSTSELGVVMQTSDVHQKSPHESRHECQPLMTMIDTADLSTQSIEVCRTSIEKLQASFDAENDLDAQSIGSTNMLFSWLVTASPEYATLLKQRRPEALVILAYYAVLLFRRRQSWAVVNAGQKLLRHIRRYLGDSWEEYLEWPMSECLDEKRD